MKNFFLLLMPALLWSCSNGPKNLDPVEIIDFKEVMTLKETPVLLSSFVNEFEYIRPEAKPGSYFTLMGIAAIGTDRIVLFEKKTGQVYLFARDGRFICQLGSLGKGPEEYHGLSAAFIFQHIQEIHLFDRWSGKILRFTPDGELKDVIHCDPVPRSLSTYKENSYICAYNYEILQKHGGEDLVVRDPVTFEKTNILFNRKDIVKREPLADSPFDLCSFAHYGDTLLFFRTGPDGDFCYRIFNEKVEPWIEFRYYSKPLHESFGLTGEDKVIVGQIGIFQTSLLLSLQGNFQFNTGYFNLITKTWSNPIFINDLDKGINFYPMGVTSDGAYHSDDLKLSYFNNFWGTKAGDTEWEKMEPKYPDRAAWLRKTVPDAEDTDNPWIMVIR